jgi:hypothetical protein
MGMRRVQDVIEEGLPEGDPSVDWRESGIISLVSSGSICAIVAKVRRHVMRLSDYGALQRTFAP